MRLKSAIVGSVLFALMAYPRVGVPGEHKGRASTQKVTNEVYRNVCGTCHLAYQPGFLPTRSWLKILSDPNAHPGGEVAMDESARKQIQEYLTANSADQRASKRSRRILRSIGTDEAPVRISELPYIKRKHKHIRAEVFARKSIGSRGNCPACHKAADDGVFSEHQVSIPR